jgi:hypothetical protein
MTHCRQVYEWSRRDKVVYSVALAPFVVALVMAACLLATHAFYLTIVFLLLYLMVNFFQAGCCVGCPYRGRYCPAVFGIYLANFISARAYAGRTFDSRFFKLNADLAEAFLLAVLLFPVYWLVSSSWVYLVVYVVLILLHAGLFFPTMCVKCSYNDTCPGGQTTLRVLGDRGNRAA